MAHHLRIPGRRLDQHATAAEAWQVSTFSLRIVKSQKRILITGLGRLNPEGSRDRVNREDESKRKKELLHFDLKLP